MVFGNLNNAFLVIISASTPSPVSPALSLYLFALMQWGEKDFGGGIVAHAIGGMSALATVIYLGSCKVRDKPHSIPLIAIGMAIL